MPTILKDLIIMQKETKNTIQGISSEVTSFTEIFNKYQERFILFANSYVRNKAVAEDICMEAMLAYWEKREKLLPGTNIPAYILTIVKNKALNHLQHMNVRVEAEDKMADHASRELNLRISTLEACNPNDLFTSEIQKIIQETIDMFPDQTLKIFIMSRFENLSNKEIAESLDLSIKSVEFHITKGLKVLRTSLKDYLPSCFLLLL